MPDLLSVLAKLSTKRSVFHSEADFQLALGWQFLEEYPGAAVRLEFRPFPSERFYVDLWIEVNGEVVAIETKYWTRRLQLDVGKEHFELLNRGAHDIMRYDFLKDVVRLERVTSEFPNIQAFAVVLTNDSAYWRQNLRTDTVDSLFRIHEGRSLSGQLRWAEHTGPGTSRGREAPLNLSATYALSWKDYSKVDPGPGGSFRFLLVSVGSV